MRIVTCDCCGQRMDRWFTITPQIESVSQTTEDIIDPLYYTTYTVRKELCETCFKQFVTQIEERRKEQ